MKLSRKIKENDHLQVRSRNENEYDTQSHSREESNQSCHASTLPDQVADIWFFNAGPIHECVLAETSKGQYHINLVLVR